MEVKPERRLRPFVPALVAGLLALGYGLFRLLQPAAPTMPQLRPPGDLRLAVEVGYQSAVVGETYTLMTEIYNTSDAVVDDVRFEIGNEFLEHFDVVAVVPQPDRVRVAGQWRAFRYPAMHPRERRTVRLELRPKAAGTFQFNAHLVSGEGTYHGMTGLPIVVVERAADAREERERSASDETR